MILKLVHNNQIGAYTFMLLLTILFWIKPMLSGYAIQADSFENAMPLWKLFAFVSKAAWLSHLFSIVSAITIALSINRLNSKYALLSKQSALPGFVFILLVGGISFTQRFNPFWLITLLFMLTLEHLFAAHNYRKVMKECFLAAFWMSVSSLFSYKMVLFFPMLIILMLTLRLVNLKSFLATLIGIVLPWLFLLGTELIWGSIPDYFKHSGFTWSKVSEIYYHTTFSMVFLISIALIFFIALFSVIRAYGTKKIYTRKQYMAFVQCGFYITAIMLFTGINLELLSLLAVPFSIIIAHLIDHTRSALWQNILFICLALMAIGGQILM